MCRRHTVVQTTFLIWQDSTTLIVVVLSEALLVALMASSMPFDL